MRKFGAVLLLLFSFTLKAQTISTIPGSVGGIIYNPNMLTFDRYGNLFIGEALGYRVIKMDTAHAFTVFAGIGSIGYSGDNGPATAAAFDQPWNVATDTFGNVYIGDAGNRRIRKVNKTTGIVTTFAGTGSSIFGGDGGPATAASIIPQGLCFDKYGNLYVASLGHKRIRKIDPMGIITTIAGDGVYASAGDGGLATAAQCSPDYNMCFDGAGNLYFVEFSNNTIRKINTSGVISTIAGNTTGAYTYSGDGVPALGAPIGPNGIAFNEFGELVISDYQNDRVRLVDGAGIIHTIVGNGTAGSIGDGGPASSAQLNGPSGIAFDKCGNLYIAQVNQPRIRKVTFNPPPCDYLETKEVAAQSISIYPNPTYDDLHIDNLVTSTAYVIVNVTGIIAQRGVLKKGNNSLPVNQLPPGMYMLQLTDEGGARTIHRVVIE